MTGPRKEGGQTAEAAVEHDIQIAVGLSSELFDRARHVARSKKTTINELASTALSGYLDQIEKKSAPSNSSNVSLPNLSQAPDRRRTSYQLPAPKVRPSRLKLTIEVDSDLAVWFKTFCGKNGYQQRDVIEAYLRSLLEQHGE